MGNGRLTTPGRPTRTLSLKLPVSTMRWPRNSLIESGELHTGNQGSQFWGENGSDYHQIGTNHGFFQVIYQYNEPKCTEI